MKRPIALIAAALMAAGLATAVTAPTAEAATTGCHITYTVPSQWWTGTQGGFQANITITNFGPPLVNWTLGFDFVHPGQRVTQGWSMTWTQSGRHVTATSMWGVLETNKPFTIGFLGSWTTSNPRRPTSPSTASRAPPARCRPPPARRRPPALPRPARHRPARHRPAPLRRARRSRPRRSRPYR
ncbi:cellulose binding domain-containing protein [Luedemannella flava]